MNLGALLSASGAGVPQMQKMQDEEQKRVAQAATMRALQQLAMQQQGGGQPQQQPPQGGMPQGGGAQPPQQGQQPFQSTGGVGPHGGGAMPPGPPPQTQGLPQQGQASPRGDTMQMIDLVSKMPNLNDTQKYQVLQNMGAYMSPVEKYTQQIELAQSKLAMQQQMLDEKMRNAVLLQGMKDTTSTSNTDKHIDAGAKKQDAKPSAQDKDEIKALDDDVALYKSEVTNGPPKDHDKNMALYKAAVKKRSEYTKNKSAAPAAENAAPSGIPEGAPVAESADGKQVYWDGKNWVPAGGK